MRIAYVIPGSFSGSPAGREELLRRESLLQSWANEGTQAIVCDVANGISSIESAYEELVAAPGGIDRIRDLEREGIDAAIIGCFGDPGLEAARELVSVPVIGPGEASLLLAAGLGRRVGILSVYDSLAPLHRGQAFRAGVLDKLASIRPLDLPVLTLRADGSATFHKCVEAGRRAVEEDGADVLVLACMSLAFLGLAPRLSNVLGVPVINAAQASLKSAEGLVSMGLSHSKKAYPLPPKMQAGRAAERMPDLSLAQI